MERIEQRTQQMYWVHSRGVQVLLPPDVAGSVEIDAQTSERLRVIEDDGILKKRYPNPRDGISFMEELSMERREQLLGFAQELTPLIVEEWKRINPNEPIAVLLYGSVAKGLVKPADHPHPSDIDIAVIGNIRDEEKHALLEASVPYREEIQRRMGVTSLPEISYPHYSGFKVQDISKVTNNEYNEAKTYIGSSAFPLYDPAGIWEKIESEALNSFSFKRKAKRKHPYKRTSQTRDLDTIDKTIRKRERTAPIPKIPNIGTIFIAPPLPNNT